MSPERQQRLFAAYPEIFANRDDRMYAISWGITCFDGWFMLIDRLCARVQTMVAKEGLGPHRIAQVKEKYGALTIYWNHAADARVQEMTWLAKDVSLHLCEICGAPGSSEETQGWWHTRCDAHRGLRAPPHPDNSLANA